MRGPREHEELGRERGHLVERIAAMKQKVIADLKLTLRRMEGKLKLFMGPRLREYSGSDQAPSINVCKLVVSVALGLVSCQTVAARAS